MSSRSGFVYSFITSSGVVYLHPGGWERCAAILGRAVSPPSGVLYLSLPSGVLYLHHREFCIPTLGIAVSPSLGDFPIVFLWRVTNNNVATMCRCFTTHYVRKSVNGTWIAKIKKP